MKNLLAFSSPCQAVIEEKIKFIGKLRKEGYHLKSITHVFDVILFCAHYFLTFVMWRDV